VLPAPPPELEPYFLPFDWDNELLWALDLAVEDVPTRSLAWHLDLPWWKGERGWFTVRPRAVLGHPGRYPEQYARTLNTDLRYPLHITLNKGRWTIVDGIHRLLKAVMLELEEVPVRKVPPAAYGRISRAA
jgi:hypothetical protein